MEIDKTTYADLSLFSREEEFSIFHKLNFTRTRGGQDQLLELFERPFSDLQSIHETQATLTLILQHSEEWPLTISNGTIMVMEKFYGTAFDEIPTTPHLLGALQYKLFHGPDYSMIRYSIGHFADFIRGMLKIANLFDKESCPPLLSDLLVKIRRLLEHEIVDSLARKEASVQLTPTQVVHYGRYILIHFKTAAFSLIDIYNKLDAWYSMAMAMRKYQLSFPLFLEREEPYMEVRSLYHPLLPAPVSYDIQLDPETNFLFLTGANMGGKSTFIRAVGVAVFLAHLGMGVPAKAMRLSLFDGILSNINVVDDISRGESYFFNEVQRIRDTLIKISGQHKWLVLIDELFKGTNVQDAMKCSSAVIKGLIKIRKSLFILSTHLYEIGEELRQYPNISFKYFETSVKDDQLEFSYQLKDGISNDRIGYLILKREKVVEMLENL
ncbi:MAG TPA: DNA mismatch repair protein MutS [Puia sp.]